jgi:hypothetical protein
MLRGLRKIIGSPQGRQQEEAEDVLLAEKCILIEGCWCLYILEIVRGKMRGYCVASSCNKMGSHSPICICVHFQAGRTQHSPWRVWLHDFLALRALYFFNKENLGELVMFHMDECSC